MLQMAIPLRLWLIEEDVSSLGKFTLFILFGMIITVGFLLNLFVIYRMTRLANGDRDQFFNGTGVYLLVMAVCDMVSLLFIFSQLVVTLFRFDFHPTVIAGLCKVSEFVSRCAYSQSMYCWLFMSGLRYLAACHPLKYSTVWRSPSSALVGVSLIVLILNLHIFASIYGDSHNGCALKIDTMSSVYNVTDIILSFALPIILIFWMDLRVLCCRAKRKSSDPLLQVVFHKLDEETEKRRASNMQRFMIITLVSLVLSFPENLLRGARVVFPNLIEPFISPALFHATKTLYFAKFSFNAFYLTSYVFDRNVLSKTSSSRQLSISIRRLEDNPSIIPRERSNTVSYRVTTPVPVLTRNSSCILLEQGENIRDWV
uniref:G_PROTEIN_RECEP_F1_2 domain-containing protein n=1 Tax=Heterorhabditis bacteriophora TaxID=37862 RepID=A0A1I7WMH6_HETBA